MIIDSYEKLPLSFFQRPNVVEIARELIGKYLVTCFDHTPTAGMIVETEAYEGRNDQACHAYQKRTPRTEVMYQEGGRAYVYLCYGIHHLFNIVTNTSGKADAVLIRAVAPVMGQETMMQRRNLKHQNYRMTAGPGSLTKALGIDMTHNTMKLDTDRLFIGDHPEYEEKIVSDRRVGVDYAGSDAALPWRFFESGNPYVSRKKQPSL